MKQGAGVFTSILRPQQFVILPPRPVCNVRSHSQCICRLMCVYVWQQTNESWDVTLVKRSDNTVLTVLCLKLVNLKLSNQRSSLEKWPLCKSVALRAWGASKRGMHCDKFCITEDVRCCLLTVFVCSAENLKKNIETEKRAGLAKLR